MLASGMFQDPTAHPVFSASHEYAVGAWKDVLISYYAERVTVPVLESVHRASIALREMHPGGMTTLGIVRAGIPMPRSDARAFAAKIGRESTNHLRGECIVIGGHPFWVGMARSALRAIELISKPWHPRAVFDTIEPAALWVVKRAGRTPAEAVTLTQAVGAIVAASDGLRRKLA